MVAPFWDLVTNLSSPRTGLPVLVPTEALAQRLTPTEFAPTSDGFERTLLALARYVGDELAGGAGVASLEARPSRRVRTSSTGHTAADYYQLASDAGHDRLGPGVRVNLDEAQPGSTSTDEAATAAMALVSNREHGTCPERRRIVIRTVSSCRDLSAARCWRRTKPAQGTG